MPGVASTVPSPPYSIGFNRVPPRCWAKAPKARTCARRRWYPSSRSRREFIDLANYLTRQQHSVIVTSTPPRPTRSSAHRPMDRSHYLVRARVACDPAVLGGLTSRGVLAATAGRIPAATAYVDGALRLTWREVPARRD